VQIEVASACKIKAGAYPAHLKLTLHNPNLPCKRENVKGKIKLYQTLQNYIYVPTDFGTIEKALSSRKRLKKV